MGKQQQKQLISNKQAQPDANRHYGKPKMKR